MGKNTLEVIPSLNVGDRIHVYYRLGFILKPWQTFTIFSITDVGGRISIECKEGDVTAYLSYNPVNPQAYLIKKKSIVKVADVRRA